MSKDELHAKDKLRAAFDMFDKDGDNKISAEEIFQIFKNNKNFDINMAKSMIK